MALKWDDLVDAIGLLREDFKEFQEGTERRLLTVLDESASLIGDIDAKPSATRWHIRDDSADAELHFGPVVVHVSMARVSHSSPREDVGYTVLGYWGARFHHSKTWKLTHEQVVALAREALEGLALAGENPYTPFEDGPAWKAEYALHAEEHALDEDIDEEYGENLHD